MAVTLEAEVLTETHRLAQLALRAAVIDAVVRIWPAFNPDELVGSWSTIEPALLALIATGGHTSAGLAAAYYGEFRAAEQVAGRATPVLATPLPVEEAVRSLRFVGLVETRQLVDAGRADAAEVAFTNVSGEMSRQVLNQGRDTLVASVDADPRALGWVRVTDSKPCAFCRMLAGRGPVYISKRSATAGSVWSEKHQRFQAHGHCGCAAEPVFSEDQPWPGRAQEFHDEWHEVVGDRSGADARLAYRQHVEGRSN
jgi:hypothetical protein